VSGPARTARRVLLVVVTVGLALAAAACRTDVEVHVRVEPDGAGAVTVTVDLDAEASTQVGDPSNLALGDLTDAGWSVDGPSEHDGGLRIVAVRPFSSPDELAAVLDEVGGADGGGGGVFSDTSLERSDGFASSSTAFRTTLQLSGDPAQFSDDELTQLLDGLPLGRTPEELKAAGANAEGAATLRVRVSLPGGVDESNGKVVRGVASWSAPMNDGTATDTTLHASSTERRSTTLVLTGLGVVLLVGAAAAVVVGLRRRHA